MGLPARAQDMFLGVTGTAGVPMAFHWVPEFNYSSIGGSIKVGADFAYPITDGIAIGAYTSFGLGPVLITYRDKVERFTSRELKAEFDWRLGLLMLVGDLGGSPFIVGLTPCTGYGVCVPVEGYLPLEMRFGMMVSGNFYLTGNLNFGVPLNPNRYIGNFFFVEPSITVGYNLGHLLRR